MPHITLPVRPRVVKRGLALMAFGGILAGVGLGWAGQADAEPDEVTVYAVANAARVCSTLDAYPSVGGVEGIVIAIVKETGWQGGPAGEAITIAVYARCPEHAPLLDAFIAKWAPAPVTA